MEVAVLCGGAGTRLTNILGDTPKILAPIGERKFIDFLFEYLRQQSGIDKVNWLLGVGAQEVQSYIEQYYLKSNFENKFIIDKKIKSGNGAALIEFANQLKTENFICIFGDSLPTVSLKPIHLFFLTNNANIGMTYIAKNLVSEKSNIDRSIDGLIRYDAKGNIEFKYVDYGVTYFKTKYLMEAKFINERDLKNVITRSSTDLELSGFEVFDPFIEIGTPNSYNTAKTKLKVRENGLY
jgi:D-glycero-alpha-D-manno-heptose 1-phosphate guanylyltransferase